MSTKSLVLHLGAHKTGTSLLQKFMRDHRFELSKQGAYYLRRSEMNDLVGWGRHVREHPELLEARIRAALTPRRHRLLIASHENTLGRPIVSGAPSLYPRAAPTVEALRDAVDGYPVRIIFYLRPQADFVESYYLQLIHQGKDYSFERWLETVDLDALSWEPVVQTLRSSFGDKNVRIMDFTAIRRGQNAFIEEFLSVADPSLKVEVNYRSIRNPSIGDKGLQLARIGNRFLKTSEERKAMRVFLQKHFSNRDYPRPHLLKEHDRSWIRQRYDTEYRRLVGQTSCEHGSTQREC